MKKVLALIQLMRPLNIIQGAIAVLVTATLFTPFPSLKLLLIGIAIVTCYSGAGNALNDYCDYQIDRINRPERPLPSGRVSRPLALTWASLLFISGTLLGLGHNQGPLLGIILFALVLLISYSLFFKRLPFIGNFTVALILGMTFLFSAALFGDWRKGIPPAFLAFGFNLIREIVKDMQDIEGDRAVGARTLPIWLGLEPTRNIVLAAIGLLCVGALLPYWLGIYGRYYLWVVLILVDLPLLYVMLALWRDSSSRNCGFLARILKGDVFFGLLAIYLGKF